MSSHRKATFLPRDMVLTIVAAILAVVVFALLFAVLDPNPSPAGRDFEGVHISETPLGHSNGRPTESLAPDGREPFTVTPKVDQDDVTISPSPNTNWRAPESSTSQPQPAPQVEPESPAEPPITIVPPSPSPSPSPAPSEPSDPALCGVVIVDLVCEILVP